jgi:spore germination protein YaaH
MPLLYTVQYGDTLPSIAYYFGTTPLSLAQLNNIPYPYSVYEGDTLYITLEMDPQTAYNDVTDYSTAGKEYVYAWENINDEQNHLDTEMIENMIGKKGTFQAGVLKFSFPRYDLDVNIKSIKLEPELALTSWMAFYQVNNDFPKLEHP